MVLNTGQTFMFSFQMICLFILIKNIPYNPNTGQIICSGFQNATVNSDPKPVITLSSRYNKMGTYKAWLTSYGKTGNPWKLNR